MVWLPFSFSFPLLLALLAEPQVGPRLELVNPEGGSALCLNAEGSGTAVVRWTDNQRDGCSAGAALVCRFKLEGLPEGWTVDAVPTEKTLLEDGNPVDGVVLVLELDNSATLDLYTLLFQGAATTEATLSLAPHVGSCPELRYSCSASTGEFSCVDQPAGLAVNAPECTTPTERVSWSRLKMRGSP